MLDALDRIDRRILDLLQNNADLSTAEIADRVGLSQSPCWRRIHRLERAGIIKKRVALLDRKKLGLDVMVFVQVKLQTTGRNTLPELERALASFPEVLECFTLVGPTDFMLLVVTKDVEAYERFYHDHLAQLPQVRETTSAIVLSEIKHTTALPIDTA